MKKSKQLLFSVLSKGQLIFTAIMFAIVIISSVTYSVVSATPASSNESPLYTIVIDAGHGGVDPGSIGYKTKVKESEVNLAVSLLLQKKLEDFGANVVMTRTTNAGLYGLSTKNYKKRDMQKRRDIIEAVNPNIVVSVHMNSYVRHNLRGAQVFYDKSSSSSELLALSIQDQFASRLPASDKGIAIGDYFMLKCTPAASVIAECGFLSNIEDEKLLIDKAYQEKLADCIFRGIVNYFNHE